MQVTNNLPASTASIERAPRKPLDVTIAAHTLERMSYHIISLCPQINSVQSVVSFSLLKELQRPIRHSAAMYSWARSASAATSALPTPRWSEVRAGYMADGGQAIACK